MSRHTGRQIDYLHPVVADLGTSRRILAAVAGLLGLGNIVEAAADAIEPG